MTEKARKIFDILGVEPMEEFRTIKDGMLFRFTDNLELQCKFSERHWDIVENVDTYRKILSGDMIIIKNTKLTDEKPYYIGE